MSAISGTALNIPDMPDDVFHMEFVSHVVGNPRTIVTVAESARTVARLAQTCRTFDEKCQNLLISLKDRWTALKEDRHCQDIGFAPELIEAFRKRNISLWRLPVLDLGGRMEDTWYIDFLDETLVTSPLMRYTDDRGRSGIAFRLRGNVDTVVSVSGIVNDEFRQGVHLPVRELRATVTIFQRQTGSQRWAFGTKSAHRPWVFGINRIYRDVHAPDHAGDRWDTCPTCPTIPGQPGGTIENLKWACKIINGVDPIWTLDGEVEQVETPLPEKASQ